jgi:L-fuconolactonase
MLNSNSQQLRIDSHRLFWKKGSDYYNWLVDDIYRTSVDFSQDEVVQRKHLTGISRALLVQATPDTQEAQHLLQIARSNESVVGVIACFDMFSPLAVNDIAKLSSDPYVKGIRPSQKNTMESNWLLKPEMIRIFHCLSNLNLCFEAMVKPNHLHDLLLISKHFPKLKIAIDHCVKPNVTMRHFESWSKDMKLLSEQENVYCKLSGLVADARHNHDVDDIIPYMQHLFNCFGAQQLMWGSDWSNLSFSTDYKNWLSITDAFLSSMDEQEKLAIWSQSAINFYGLRQENMLSEPNYLRAVS